MIDSRPKQDRELTAITWSVKAAQATAGQFNILLASFNHLLCMYVIQKETRELVTSGQLAERLGRNSRWIHELLPLHYVERVTNGEVNRYNVTNSGEYVVRAYLIRLNRLVNDTKLSKARLTRKKKEKLSQYMRVATKKGVKLY